MKKVGCRVFRRLKQRSMNNVTIPFFFFRLKPFVKIEKMGNSKNKRNHGHRNSKSTHLKKLSSGIWPKS